MRPLMLNRLALVLAFFGVFIAGVMSVGHALSAQVPCGPGGGCEAVTQHSSAFWLGLPVAYYGVGAYLTLAAIAAVRQLKGLASTGLLGVIALLIAGVGTLASLYLQYVAISVIQSFCPWCLASAVTMALLFMTNAALYNVDEPERLGHRRDLGLVGALAALVAVALVLTGMKMKSDAAKGPADEIMPTDAALLAALMPPDSMRLGPGDAPIKIIEFTDQLCAACRKMHPELKKIVQENPGKVEWIYRHWPMPMRGHEMSFPAAFLVEYAAEKGKGWEYVEILRQVKSSEILSLRDLFETLRRVGLDPRDAARRIDDENDQARLRVVRDAQMAMDTLQLKQTPTFIVFAPEAEPKKVTMSRLKPLLNQPAYQKVLGREIK